MTLAVVTRNGEKRFSATLSNKGKKSVTLVEAGDGSEAGWRTRMLEWIATTPAGKPAQPVQLARCGLTNPIDEREVFTLAPGQSKTMIDWLDQPRVVKGHYDARLVYKNDPHHGSTGKGGMSPAAAAKIAASTPCKVTSNTIGYDAP